MHKKPITYMGHPVQETIRVFLRKLFADPTNKNIEQEAANFLADISVPISDFPPPQGFYSRTILYRSDNGFEAMAARWGEGSQSVIHGHPNFAFYHLLEGELTVENFVREGDTITKTETVSYMPGQCFCLRGSSDSFDNGIHRVTAPKESLSIHIYSDDAMKGEIFS